MSASAGLRTWPWRAGLLLDALNRYRGKEGQQKVTVEHVDVHAGGQWIRGV